MRMPVLTCVFILIVLIAFSVRKGKDSYARQEASFWDRERRANSTRKKPIDDLTYIEVPADLVSEDKNCLDAALRFAKELTADRTVLQIRSVITRVNKALASAETDVCDDTFERILEEKLK